MGIGTMMVMVMKREGGLDDSRVICDQINSLLSLHFRARQDKTELMQDVRKAEQQGRHTFTACIFTAALSPSYTNAVGKASFCLVHYLQLSLEISTLRINPIETPVAFDASNKRFNQIRINLATNFRAASLPITVCISTIKVDKLEYAPVSYSTFVGG